MIFLAVLIVESGTMEAVRSTGPSPEGVTRGTWNFEVAKVPIPKPTALEALIKVAGASVNPVDWKLALHDGPKTQGLDYSGIVAGTGLLCRSFAVGDEVYGVTRGTFAQYTLAPCGTFGRRSAGSPLSLIDYGTLGIGAGTSLTALWKSGLTPNSTVVVTSGSGGTGVFAIMIAKALGAGRVITAARAAHAPLLRELGADLVVDYTQRSLWDVLPTESVDVVYDNFGANGTADRAMPSLKSCATAANSTFIFLPGKGGAISSKPKPGVRQINYGEFMPTTKAFAALDAMAVRGELRAVVQANYSFAQVGRAYSVNAAGHVVGKLGVLPPPH